MSATTRRQQIEEMLQSEPNDPELRYMQAMEFVSEGNDARAAQCFQELVAVAAQFPPAYHMGARTLQRLNRIDEAKTLLQRGIPVALAQGNSHAAGEMQELYDSME